MEVSHCLFRTFTIACLFLGVVYALGQNASVAFSNSAGSLLLGSRNSYVTLMLDGADWPGVLKVANDLAVDFGRVTGVNGTVSVVGQATVNASMIFNITGRTSFATATNNQTAKGGTIIAGTVGNSSLIDSLIVAGKLDVSQIEGKWEAFQSQIVKEPMNGVEQALVIVGSDRRGTIYGLYDISEQIGVSPWYYFADVAPKSHDEIHATPRTKVQGSPTVKYRGFFLNDEAPALTGYANVKFPKSKWGCAFNADFYSHVFEVLLRLRANYLWPAQWNGMFNVDDPRNQPLADEYAIVMGTSHTEPMVRATKEWTVFGNGPWQWNTNNASIAPFMKEGVERAKPYENVVTIGMRGSGDTALSANVETDVLEDVVNTQQKILDEVYGNATDVPQMWCLYKEVQDYYEAGMRVPDHVTLLWTEDNWGNIRRLPVGNETSRSGGAGVYYHFDYVGDPRDYKWINTIQLQKTREQMNQAVLRDATRIWIVNVGDLKPLEIPINHFFDLAYDINLWNETSVPNWLEQWATREFNSDMAKEIANVVDQYSYLAALRKYELIEPNSFSVLDYEEADRVLSQWQGLGKTAQAIYNQLPDEQKPAFFEMVLHPVLAGGTFIDVQISSAKNQMYAGQGRNSANAMAQRVMDKFSVDHQLTVQYNTMLNGKWNHMMDQTHLGYQGYWQQPMRQMTPALYYVQNLERDLAGDMGVAVEGSNATIPGDDKWHTNGGGSLTLPAMDPFGPKRWIDIFSMGTQAFTWTIQADSFVQVSRKQGKLSPTMNNTDTRVYISIDWTKAPTGSNASTLNITSSTDYGTQYSMPTVSIPLNNTVLPSNFTSGFVESNAFVSMEAAHYTQVIPSSANSSLSYQQLPGYGRYTSPALTLSDPLSPSLTSATAPALLYKFCSFTPTTAKKALNVTLMLAPTLNTTPKRPLAYIVQLDDLPEQRRQYVIDQPQPNMPVGWYDAVANAAWYNTTSWGAIAPGEHTLRVSLVEPGAVLMKILVDMGGVQPSYLGPPESYRKSGETD